VVEEPWADATDVVLWLLALLCAGAGLTALALLAR
jgi:hypothetical protein